MRSMNRWYSSQVPSCLPIQKVETSTMRWGPSDFSRPSSPLGLPSWKVPEGIGTMSKVTSVPTMRSV